MEAGRTVVSPASSSFIPRTNIRNSPSSASSGSHGLTIQLGILQQDPTSCLLLRKHFCLLFEIISLCIMAPASNKGILQCAQISESPIHHKVSGRVFLHLNFTVLMIHEQAAPALQHIGTSTTRNIPGSLRLQEQRDEDKTFLQTLREGRMAQAIVDRRQLESGSSVCEAYKVEYDLYLKELEHHFLHFHGLWYLLPSLQIQGKPSLSMQSVAANEKKLVDVSKPHCDAVALAKKALSASQEAASLAEDSEVCGDDESLSSSLATRSSYPVKEKIVRSSRLLERRSKKRRVPIKKMVDESFFPKRAIKQKRATERLDLNDPLQLFLSSPETTELLTSKEESELIVQIQELSRLQEVKSRLQAQFDREPTLVEWAKAVGINCWDLQSQLRSGKNSREKLIYANFRMVVHIAKQYKGRGLSLPDLLQEGSMGLMKSVEKFKPQAGCRFATYAYWWIRQSIRKAIFQHSRTVRLPENVYTLLGKVQEAKRSYVQEGNHDPTTEELSRRVGITIERLENLLHSTRMPLSMQQPIWSDQDTTFQEITADPEIEIPEVSVAKQLMRRHVRNLLSILNPRERQIIRLRFGIEDGNEKSLSDIGNVFGLSKERVRQLESRALYKLKQCLSSQGLEAYTDMLV
ncbi:RNA polymerase sigma-70 region 4 [Dillenia turbinata]|uniref:RNA polymerase sigma-70 region 4 n=1 Tax=Dillenia turbinata TaxID=194707 RepID=A0AAN8ZNF8_9MAGN